MAYLPSDTIRKIVILMVLIWSIATVFVGFTSSVYVILICRDCSVPKAFIGRSGPASPATGFQTKNGRGRTALSVLWTVRH
ncbi:hypothetical protein KCP69_26445 [Salmonella enterica subsp. enterica]|nr:hypothetical protein KCP69_26445 [Salmonella enterica subsp. enterica]